MQNLKLLGIPFDYGQSHPGVRLASEFLKQYGLINRLSQISPIIDLGEINLPQKISDNSSSSIKNSLACSLGNKAISDVIADEDLSQSFLLNVGGDHGLALGSVDGVLKHYPEAVVIWADAHGDINTPQSSPSGNFHGMPLAVLLGILKHPEFNWVQRRLLPEKLIFLGPRDLDQGEKDLIQKYNIQYFSSEEINRIGSNEIISMALHKADPMGVCPIHLSFDVDLFDQFDITATGTKVANGPKMEEVFLMGGLLAETGRLVSMDLVEFNPLIGDGESVQDSAQLIIEFLESTLKQVFSTKKSYSFQAIPENYYTKGQKE